MNGMSCKLIVLVWAMHVHVVNVDSSAIVGKPEAEEYNFEALQCNDIRTSAVYSGKRFCDPDSIRKESGISERNPGGVYTIIQHSPIRKFKGTKCEKKVSTITAVCGAFSHSKLVTPMDILTPVMINEKDCLEMYRSQMVTTEDERQLRINIGSTITYKYVESGSVTLSEDNVACEGGEVKIFGKKHENVLKLVTVSLKLVEIDVWEKQGRLKTEDGILPRQCSLAVEGCGLDDMTLVLDLSKINLCPYAKIREVNLETISTKEQHMLINDEHKILLTVKDKVVIPIECVLRGSFIRTNFDRLLLYPGELGQNVDMIDPVNLDLELETRVTDFYLSYWTLSVNKESETKWQSELCEMATTKMSEEQVIFHDKHVLRLQGEVVIEFPCEEVRVRTQKGYQISDECLDHLPVVLPDGTVKFMTPITRVLVEKNAVSQVNCSDHFPLLFEDTDGRMIAANPAAQVIDITVNNYHHLDSSSKNHSEMFSFSSLLYTEEEVMSYEQLILGHNAEKIVTKQFSSFYCRETGECQPSRLTQDFRWKELVNPMEMVNDLYESAKAYVMWWGALWGCIDSILTLSQIVIKLVIVHRNLGKRQLGRKAIFRFVFLPGHELINLFPKPQHPSETERSVQMESEMQERAPLNGNPE